MTFYSYSSTILWTTERDLNWIGNHSGAAQSEFTLVLILLTEAGTEIEAMEPFQIVFRTSNIITVL